MRGGNPRGARIGETGRKGGRFREETVARGGMVLRRRQAGAASEHGRQHQRGNRSGDVHVITLAPTG
jgi:hypothetical protein